jgi:hypothetical protein
MRRATVSLLIARRHPYLADVMPTGLRRRDKRWVSYRITTAGAAAVSLSGWAAPNLINDRR